MLKGKCVLVTGSTQGLGYAMAERLAAELVTVLLNASCTVTCTAGAMDAPATVLAGWTLKASLAAAAGLMLNAAEEAPVSAPDAAVSV